MDWKVFGFFLCLPLVGVATWWVAYLAHWLAGYWGIVALTVLFFATFAGLLEAARKRSE